MISASIVTYNTSTKDLEKVVGCISSNIVAVIYVIDNSPTDALRDYALSLSEKIEYIHGHGNVGYGSGHNIAIRKAKDLGADYHIIINPDIYLESKSISIMRDFMERHPDVGLVMPNVVYPNGELQYLCKQLPTPLDIFLRRFLPKVLRAKRDFRYEMRAMGYDKVWNCPILSGCFMFMRMSFLNQAGGFDERFFMYFEDFDLMRRLHQICKTVFLPQVTIVHDHAAEHRTNSKLLKASVRSAIQYFNKWGWVFDAERRRINKTALSEINLIKE